MMKKIRKRTEINLTSYGEKVIAKEEVFDESGRLLKSVKYFESGELESKSVFEYENGQLATEITVNEYGEENKTDYIYDAGGELSYKRIIFGDGTVEHEKRILEPGKEIIENYNEAGQVSRRQIVYLDGAGRRSKIEFFENEDLVETDTFEYDAQGQLAGRAINDWSEKANYFYRFEYNDTGARILMELTGENDSLLQREVSVYKNGSLIEFREEDFFGTETRQITKFEYDETGNVVRETKFDWSGNIKSDRVIELNRYGDPVFSTTVKTGHFNAVFGTGDFGGNFKTRYELEYF